MLCGYKGIFFYILETLAIDMSYLQLYVNKASHMPNVVPIYSIWYHDNLKEQQF